MASSRATASAQASSTRSSVPSKFTALATSSTEPSAWSSTARSVASIIVISGTPSSSGTSAGTFSQCRTASYEMAPTMPPVSGGRPSMGSVASAATVSRRASRGLPLVGTPTGGSPTQWASPSRSVSTAPLAAPTME